MAQDFGDDAGDVLVRALGRALRRTIEDIISDRAKTWHSEKNEKEGMSKKDADIQADLMASRPHACIPFGNADDAAYFAQVVRENGTYAEALTDPDGGGYVYFAKDDIEQVKQCVPQFSEVMTALKNEQIAEILDSSEPVTEEVFNNLTPITKLPDLPTSHDAQDAPGRDEATVENDTFNHTERIRDKVLAAREQCRDLDDFEKILDKEGIGVTATKDGEQMFYEARRGEDGALLPRGTDENGMQDWAVSAKTLANDKWGCDATLDWFEKNTPKEPGVPVREAVLSEQDLTLISNSVRSDLEERSIETRDRADGKMGFHVNADCRQAVIDAVQARFPGHTPEELGIVLDPHFNLDYKTVQPRETEVTDGSLDTNGSTPDINQGIESHDGMDTMVSTLRVEREQNGTEVAPSMVREQSDRSREEYDLRAQVKECRAASKQLAQSNDSPDRDISDKFQQER